MRILHVTHQYLPQHTGGVELYTQSLSRQLLQQGHQVAIFTRQNRGGQGLHVQSGHNGHFSPVVYATWHGKFSPARRFAATFGEPALLRYFTEVLQQFDPELIHIQHLMGLPAQIVQMIARHRRPYVITLHDYWWICANANLLTNYSAERCAGPQAYLNCTRCLMARAAKPLMMPVVGGAAPLIWGGLLYRRALLRRILLNAHAIAAPSHFVRRWYVQQGISQARIQVLPLGVERLHPEIEYGCRQERSHRTPVTSLNFLYIGGLSPLKGVHVALRAFSLLKTERKVTLQIVGELEQDPAYTRRLRTLEQSGVFFKGRLNRHEVRLALEQCHVLLVPSLCDETFCFVAHEALLADRPVFASDVGALTDLIRERENGRLLPPGDVDAWRTAMQEIVDEPRQIQCLLPSSSSWQPEIWTVKQHTDQVMAMYQSAIEHHRGQTENC